jgi:hypothetical protein
MQWSTVASLATAGGTLVLAIATFSATRSSNRSARLAERAILLRNRPVLSPSRLDDRPEKVPFIEQKWFRVKGGHAVVEHSDGVLYLVMGVRNVGTGLAVLRGWRARPGLLNAQEVDHAPLESFQRQGRDIYIPAGDTCYWQGAIRNADDPDLPGLLEAVAQREIVTVELLYGDGEGGQRVISRFGLLPIGDENDWLTNVSRHWNLDRDDPR